MIILHVDDDADDRELLEYAFRNLEPRLQVKPAASGFEAVEYLKHAKTTGALPCLVVLDINMPGLNGRQTLENIRHDLHLMELPVVILTSSQNPHDHSFFKEKGSELLNKPANPDGLRIIARKLLSYCL